MLALRLFGGLSLESDAGRLPPAAVQRRRLTLLALLALAGERGASRERVQAHLWPESTAERARHALEQLLYATRRDLGRDVILSTTSELRLNPAAVFVDVWAFDEAIRKREWERAVALHAGPVLDGQYLADGAELESWLERERAAREQECHAAVERLATEAAAAGHLADAARWWHRRAAADPFSARVALELMRTLHAGGDSTGALRHARIHEQLVRSTLEIEPDPAVAAFAAEIAAARAVHAPASATAATPQPAAPSAGAFSTAEAAAPAESPPNVMMAPPSSTVAGPAAEPTAAPPVGARPSRRRRSPLVGMGALAAAVVVVVGLLVHAERTGTVAAPASAPPELGGPARAPTEPSRPPDDDIGGTTDARARALYLRARMLWARRTRNGLEQSVVLFRQATERDPTYAAAYGGLAEAYAMLGYFGFEPGDAMFPKARAAALQAIALDSMVGGAYAALGQALAWSHRWTEAERAYQRALRLAPQNATVHQWYALLLAYLGRAREAAYHTGEAARLDPLSVQINNMYGMMLYYAGDLPGALRQYERTVEAEPDSAWVRQNPWVLTNYARIAAAAGRHAQALALIQRALAVVPGDPRPLLDLAYAYVVAGRPDSARLVFARADRTHPHYAVYRGLLYAQLGALDSAFVWLDRVDPWPLPSFVGLSNEPRYAALRADPRFENIRRRLALPAR